MLVIIIEETHLADLCGYTERNLVRIHNSLPLTYTGIEHRVTYTVNRRYFFVARYLS